MPAAANISQVIAYSAGNGYYDPISGEAIDTILAAQYIAEEHAAGNLVRGIDSGTGTLDDIGTGEVSAAVNAQNLAIASNAAAAQLGLNRADQGNWLQSEMVHYLQTLKGIILAHPENFTAASVAVAQHLNVQPDLANDVNGQKLIDPTGIALYIEDAIAGAAQTVADITPNPVRTGVQAVGAGAQALADAALRAAGAIQKTAALLEYAIPIGIMVMLYFGTRAIGKDPGGQGGKVLSAGAKTVATFI